LIYKTIDNKSNKNTEYHLTEKGNKINLLLYEIVKYVLYVLEDELRSEKLKQQLDEEYKEILNI